jgi:hypothetical protein
MAGTAGAADEAELRKKLKKKLKKTLGRKPTKDEIEAAVTKRLAKLAKAAAAQDAESGEAASAPAEKKSGKKSGKDKEERKRKRTVSCGEMPAQATWRPHTHTLSTHTHALRWSCGVAVSLAECRIHPAHLQPTCPTMGPIPHISTGVLSLKAARSVRSVG